MTKCDEHCVTGGMPEFVVDALEAIDVEKKKRVRPAREACSDHQPFGRLEKATPVCNAGQWVDPGGALVGAAIRCLARPPNKYAAQMHTNNVSKIAKASK